MILADTSAWIELLRRTGSPTNVAIRQRLHDGLPIVHNDSDDEVLARPTSLTVHPA